MNTVTIQLDRRTIDLGRDEARSKGVSFDTFVAGLVERAVVRDTRAPADSPPHDPATGSAADAVEAFDDLLDEITGDSGGWEWKRDELYRE